MTTRPRHRDLQRALRLAAFALLAALAALVGAPGRAPARGTLAVEGVGRVAAAAAAAARARDAVSALHHPVDAPDTADDPFELDEDRDGDEDGDELAAGHALAARSIAHDGPRAAARAAGPEHAYAAPRSHAPLERRRSRAPPA